MSNDLALEFVSIFFISGSSSILASVEFIIAIYVFYININYNKQNDND